MPDFHKLWTVRYKIIGAREKNSKYNLSFIPGLQRDLKNEGVRKKKMFASKTLNIDRIFPKQRFT